MGKNKKFRNQIIYDNFSGIIDVNCLYEKHENICNRNNKNSRDIFAYKNNDLFIEYNNLKYTIEVADGFINTTRSFHSIYDEKLWSLYCDLHLCTWFGCPYLKRYPALILKDGKRVNRYLCSKTRKVFRKCGKNSFVRFKGTVKQEELCEVTLSICDK